MKKHNAIHLYNDVLTGDMVVAVEINKKWVPVIRTFVGVLDVQISHIVESGGIQECIDNPKKRAR